MADGEDYGLVPDQVIGYRCRQLRDRKGWTAQQLADAMNGIGMTDWTRIVVTKLENWPKYRRSVTVEELLTLAYVLDVAPIHLMVPIEGGLRAEMEEFYQVTPDLATSLGAVREWIRGEG